MGIFFALLLGGAIIYSMKKIFKIIPYVLIAILIGFTVSYAGSLTPPGSPAQSMKKLSDLYQLVNTGANTPDTSFTTPGSISATMNSIGDVYDLLTTKIAAIDTTKILTGTSIFGKAGSATPAPAAPVFATSDETTYQCENLTTDPIQPAVTFQTICGYHAGCSWNGSACTGGTKTPGYFTWYSAKAACANTTREGQIAGIWRLPTYPELVENYLNHNINGDPPTGFDFDTYWSGTTLPGSLFEAYVSYSTPGNVTNDPKNHVNDLVHCVR